MSGPKTSHISIQEQIRQAIAAANAVVKLATSGADMALRKQRDQVASHAGFNAGSQGDQSYVQGANTCFSTATAELDAIQKESAQLSRLASIDEMNAVAQRLADKARAIQEKAEAELRAYEQEAKDAQRRFERSAKASDYASMLQSVMSDARYAEMRDAADATMASPAIVESHSTTSVTWDDIAEAVGDATRRYMALMAHPEYLPASNVRVLIAHGATFLRAVQACSEDANQAQLLAASNQAKLMLEVLPTFEAEADRMREVRAETAAIASGMGLSPDAVPSSFATLDEAEQYLAELKQASSAYADQRYIQSCIDDVMRRHGYDIARSVSLERSGEGDNLIFGMADADDGIHVFMNDKGDMMMEAVGVSDLSELPEGAPMRLDKTEDGDQAQFLLEVQVGFCSVYAEIESELAEYGIAIDTVNRCAPDVRFSKELRTQGVAEDAGDVAPLHSKSAPTSTRKRRRSTSARERAL